MTSTPTSRMPAGLVGLAWLGRRLAPAQHVSFSLSQAAALHRSSHRSKRSRGLEKLISQAGHPNGVDPPACRPAVCLCAACFVLFCEGRGSSKFMLALVDQRPSPGGRPAAFVRKVPFSLAPVQQFDDQYVHMLMNKLMYKSNHID